MNYIAGSIFIIFGLIMIFFKERFARYVMENRVKIGLRMTEKDTQRYARVAPYFGLGLIIVGILAVLKIRL